MTTAEVAADSYRQMAERLGREALDTESESKVEKAAGHPGTAEDLHAEALRLADYARICYGAARREEADTRARA